MEGREAIAMTAAGIHSAQGRPWSTTVPASRPAWTQRGGPDPYRRNIVISNLTTGVLRPRIGPAPGLVR